MRAVCESFHLSKDAGFKVVAHMMPDLPNVGMERDVEQFIVSIHKYYLLLFLTFYIVLTELCCELVISNLFWHSFLKPKQLPNCRIREVFPNNANIIVTS